MTAWENSWLFATPPLASPRNDLWRKFPPQHDQSEALPASHQYGISALVSQTSGNADCFLRLRMTGKLAYCHSRPKSYCDPFAQHHGSKALKPKPEVANHRLPAFCAVSDMWNNNTKMSNYCACAIFCSQLGQSVPLTKRIATLEDGIALLLCTDLPQWQGWLVYPEHLELASNLHFARFSFVSFQAFQSLNPQQDCTSSPR